MVFFFVYFYTILYNCIKLSHARTHIRNPMDGWIWSKRTAININLVLSVLYILFFFFLSFVHLINYLYFVTVVWFITIIIYFSFGSMSMKNRQQRQMNFWHEKLFARETVCCLFFIFFITTSILAKLNTTKAHRIYARSNIKYRCNQIKSKYLYTNKTESFDISLTFCFHSVGGTFFCVVCKFHRKKFCFILFFCCYFFFIHHLHSGTLSTD